MFRHILVPTDGSAASGRAIRQAVQLAREQKARITGLHVAPPYRPHIPEESTTYNVISPREYQERAAAHGRRIMRPLERAAAAAGVRCDLVTAVSDRPYDEIVRTANRRKCDLIYMASQGRTGLSRLLLGSQAAKVLALAKVPVIVTR